MVSLPSMLLSKSILGACSYMDLLLYGLIGPEITFTPFSASESTFPSSKDILLDYL